MDPILIATLITQIGVPAVKYLLEKHASGEEWTKQDSANLLALINIPIEAYEKGIVNVPIGINPAP